MADKTRVAPLDPGKKNSPISGPIETESTVELNIAKSGCHWNGQSFAEGDRVESEGVVYECNCGQWARQNN